MIKRFLLTFIIATLLLGSTPVIIYTPVAASTAEILSAWEYSGAGQLGDDSTTDRTTPIQVSGLSDDAVVVTALSASTITLGGSVTDTATVSVPGPMPTGTVDFQVSSDNGTTWNKFGATKTLSLGSATSDGYAPLATGSYLFRAVYSGDTNYGGSQSADNAEPLTVNKADVLYTNTALSSSNIILGASVTDTTSFYGIDYYYGPSYPTPTGTVDFQVSGDNGTTWTQFGVTKPLSGNFYWNSKNATSDAYTPAIAGSYLFRAVYSGDTNYNGWQSADNAEPLTVNKAGSYTSTHLSASNLILGGSVTDNATVSGTGTAATGTVDFQVSGDNGATWNKFGATKTLSGGLATSDTYTPAAAGSYLFRAVYSGDTNYNGSQSANTAEPLIVDQTIATALSASFIILGGSVTDTATVSGTSPTPTGTVDFQVSGDNGATWNKFGATKTLSGGSATSDAYTPAAAGVYLFRAVYSGDGNYAGCQSADNAEPLTVNAVVVTALSASTITLGGSVTDTATVSVPGPMPTGTVDFQVSSDNGTTWNKFGATKTLSLGSATSDGYAPLATGSYLFRAVYSGDTNYGGSQSADNAEPLTVNKADVLYTNTALSSSNIILGASVTDTTSFYGIDYYYGPSYPTPTGTVDFQVSGDNGTTWTQFGVTKPLSGNFYWNSKNATSDAYTPAIAGSYLFRAVYSGDTNYNGWQSADNAEPLTVNKAGSYTSTHLSASNLILGGSVTDNATVSGTGTAATGTVDFQVSGDNGATWNKFGATKTLSGGLATSDTYTPAAAGSYLFRAVYSGDTNYNGSQSANTAEPLIVDQTIATALSASFIILGGSVTDTATVSGTSPTPTGTVDFQVSGDNGATWNKFGATKTLSGGSATSDAYTPAAAGVYLFRAVYSGDGNYAGCQSADNAEPLTVNAVVVTALSASTITLGGSVTDTATVSVPGPMPTGTVDFQVSSDNGTTWNKFGATKTLSLGSATSDGYAPLATGSYLFRAVYSGDTNYGGSQSADNAEPLTVNKADVLYTNTALSSSNIILGASVTDTTSFYGIDYYYGPSYPTPTGTVDFQVSGDNGTTWTQFGVTKPLSGNFYWNSKNATSDAYTPAIAGSYLFRAVYSGDTNYNGWQSADNAEPLTVNKAGSYTSTHLSASNLILGGSVTDNATVSGTGTAATGTVDFQVSGDNGATWNKFGATKTLSGGLATSDTYTPAAAGSYLFRVVYSGDTNYNGSQSANTAEPLTVDKADSATATILSNTTITLGGSVTDNATVSGAGPTATGNVTFEVSTDGGTTFAQFGVIQTLVSGSATSDSYTPAVAGNSYRFRAVYSGDTNYNGSQSEDQAEQLTVNKASSTTATLLSNTTITLGGNVTDNATVSVSAGPTATGNVTFEVSTNGGTTFTQFGAVKTLVVGSATSDSYTPTVAGNSYRFRAVYSGDTNYNGSRSGDQAEPLTVDKAGSTTATLLSNTTITLGGSVTDTAIVSGIGPTATGTVDFQVSGDNGTTWNKFGATKTLSGGSAISDAYTPAVIGSYLFRAVYSGDINYNGSQSVNNAEPLSVRPMVAGISPTSGPAAGGTAVTITGTGFVSGATVTIGGALATNVTWVSATSITATTPAGMGEAQNVVVSNPDAQSGTLMGGFTYIAAPTVTTESVSSIATTTATGNGNVTSDGGSVIIERGIVWNTSGSPTIFGSKATAPGTTGTYTASITGLTVGTPYHVRAYAINAIGTSYGGELTFTTQPTTPTTVLTATGAGSASFSASAGTITGLTAVAEGTFPTAGKPNLTFPFGFFSFNITGLTSGQTVNVTITLPSTVPIGTQYWKYQASKGGWIRIPMGDDDGDNVITITLVDGGLGDADLLANGTIVDPGGPGIPPVPVPASSGLSLGLLIVGLAALIMLLTFRRVRQSQR